MSDRDLMQQALDAMMTIRPYEVVDYDQLEASITALKAALAQPEQDTSAYHGWVLREVLFDNGEPVGHREPEQEPVAWLSEGGDVSRSKRYMDEMGFKCNPLYTAPPKKQWVGLTDEDYKELSKIAFVEVIEKIERVLKEKNA